MSHDRADVPGDDPAQRGLATWTDRLRFRLLVGRCIGTPALMVAVGLEARSALTGRRLTGFEVSIQEMAVLLLLVSALLSLLPRAWLRAMERVGSGSSVADLELLSAGMRAAFSTFVRPVYGRALRELADSAIRLLESGAYSGGPGAWTGRRAHLRWLLDISDPELSMALLRAAHAHRESPSPGSLVCKRGLLVPTLRASVLPYQRSHTAADAVRLARKIGQGSDTDQTGRVHSL
jgi:hypothetical protein